MKHHYIYFGEGKGKIEKALSLVSFNSPLILFMSRPIQIKNHPFRFLLYLEWVLLGMAILGALEPSRPGRHFSNQFPELTIFSLILFGLIGLRLPTGKQVNKVAYTACEVCLILITIFFGGRASRLFPFIYLILMTRSCLIFQLPGRIAVTILSFTLFLLTTFRKFQSFPLPPGGQERFRFFSFSFVVLFGLALVFVLLLMNTMVSERQGREKLAAANEKLREYALRIENQATLEERNRIAREIHDSLGHSLTVLNLQLETALKLWQANPEKAQSFLKRAKELGSETLHHVRQSVSAMRAYSVLEQSLDSAIFALIEDFQLSTNIKFDCHIESQPLTDEINTAIYRIIQESVTNICKHAQATEVKLQLTVTAAGLHLLIQDNGIGFNLSQNTTGFGLQSMRDRTLAIGGDFNIESSPGQGCKIDIEIPRFRL